MHESKCLLQTEQVSPNDGGLRGLLLVPRRSAEKDPRLARLLEEDAIGDLPEALTDRRYIYLKTADKA